MTTSAVERAAIAAAVVAIQASRGENPNALSGLVKKTPLELHQLLGSLIEAAPIDTTVKPGSNATTVATAVEPVAPPDNGRGEGHARATFSEDDVITLNVTTNPKRQGSATYARFGLLRNGVRVREFLNLAERKGSSQRQARRLLRRAVAAGEITVSQRGG